MELKIIKTKSLKPKPKDETKLGFGKIFTDYMFNMDYNKEKGWYNPRIEAYQDLILSPATTVLHYGQTIFDGLKAYKTKEGGVNLFRPKDNFERLNKSAEFMCIPKIDVKFVLKSLKELLKIEKDWIPKTKGSSLYIRPTIIATDPYVGLKTSDSYRFFIILSPVGAYYAEGFNPVKILVTKDFVRAVRGGLGEAKTAANYAASIKASQLAQDKGFAQVLWLDGIKQKYIEEVGSMNIFFIINNTLITPKLNGSILNGITRDSVLKIAKSLKMKAQEKRISIDEIISAYKNKSLQEIFGSGTAAVISPVGEISWLGKSMKINNGKVGKISKKFFDILTGIQYGEIKDSFKWTEKVN